MHHESASSIERNVNECWKRNSKLTADCTYTTEKKREKKRSQNGNEISVYTFFCFFPFTTLVKIILFFLCTHIVRDECVKKG
jgi:hypothetical protein